MWSLIIIFVILLIVRHILNNHIDLPSECRYLEVFWEYPVSVGSPIIYEYEFTNKPKSPYKVDGNMGISYTCFDLFNIDDIHKISHLNDLCKKFNFGVKYIPEKVIDQCLDNYESYSKVVEY